MKKGSDDFELLFFRATATSATIEFENNIRYSFLSIATDHAGNVENKDMIPDFI